MSALGQKQTCAAQKVMSALPPKADMCSAKRDVRLVPIADINVANWVPSKCQIRKSRWWNGGPGFEKRRPTF